MDNPNANIILRRKFKAKAKTGSLYLELMRSQVRGETMEWLITKKCREMRLQPMVAMRGISKYLKKTDWKAYKLSFSQDIMEWVDHFVEEYELLKSLSAKDKNIILSILIYKYHNDR
jgi:hypothetical protein